MTARNLALEALKELVAHFGEEHSGKFYEGGCALCIAIERANAAIAALEAETGEPVAPTPWPSLSGNYIFPSPTRDSRLFGNAPAAPDIGILKEVTEALAARLGTNADEWPLVRAARAIVEDAS
jgi:hypothetical protein